MIFIFFIVIFIIIIATTLKNGKNEKIDKYLEKQQEKYLIDFKNNKPIFAKTPILFSETEIYSFPFIKYFCPFKQLKIIFEKIKTTKIDIKYDLYEVDEIDNFKATSGWITFAKNYDGYYFITLIDYFQEDCRMLCQRVNAKTNFITFFDQNKKKIEQSIPKPLTYLKIIDESFKRYVPCSEFNPIWLTNMIPIFEKHTGPIKNMLDMSAGRGARMMACAALGIDYLGIDPCECANKNYPLMKKFARYCGAKSKIKFLNTGFEETWIMPKFFANTQFDLMFTSPPYFDLEIYEDTSLLSNDDKRKQSIDKYSSLENWLDKFLKVCMCKILNLLRSGGIMAINIDNPVHIKKDYVNPMLNLKFDNAKYLGVIRINYGAKFHTWCWQKI